MGKNTKTTDPYKIRQEEVKNFAEQIANTQRIWEDMDLTGLVREETYLIMGEATHDKDGNWIDYDGRPLFKVFRDKDNTLRIYGIDGAGGIVLVEHGNHVQILTLGEDDGSYFLNSARIYETYYGGHTGFMYLLSEVLSFYNNIKHK